MELSDVRRDPCSTCALAEAPMPPDSLDAKVAGYLVIEGIKARTDSQRAVNLRGFESGLRTGIEGRQIQQSTIDAARQCVEAQFKGGCAWQAQEAEKAE